MDRFTVGHQRSGEFVGLINIVREKCDTFRNTLLQTPVEVVQHSFFLPDLMSARICLFILLIFAPKVAVIACLAIYSAVIFFEYFKPIGFEVDRISLSINAFFLNLALQALHLNTGAVLIFTVFSPILLFHLTAILKKILSSWALPPLVLPYMLISGFLWHLSLASQPNWLSLSSKVIQHPLMSFTPEFFRFLGHSIGNGLSSLFFLNDPHFGWTILIAVLALYWKLAITLLGLLLYWTMAPHFMGVEAWQIYEGLTVFPGFFLWLFFQHQHYSEKNQPASLASQKGYTQFKWIVFALAPWVELVCIRIGYIIQVPSLSLAVLLLLWSEKLWQQSRSVSTSFIWSSMQRNSSTPFKG